jgi:excisionase family DNA binding protein
MKSLLNLKTAAVKLGMTYDFLLTTIDAGYIKTLNIGKRRLISEAEISRFKTSVAA